MTDMSKEAMKLALEALNTTESDCGSRAWEREQEAITALREALASEAIEQPAQQEPVAWISKHGVVYPLDAKDEVHPINELHPLYTSPPAQEFVCSTGLCHYRKPLTDGQVIAIANMAQPGWVRKDSDLAYLQVARAIEAAHGIKENT